MNPQPLISTMSNLICISNMANIMESITVLKKIALLGGLHGAIRLSSSEFADVISSSSQTASRRLQALEQTGYITRRVDPGGQQIMITKQGHKALEAEYLEYREIFARKPTSIELAGIVITGLGEGQYYTMLKGYRDQFITLLGIDPFPGTLNIRLEPESMSCRSLLNLKNDIEIKGFSTRNRTFGAGRCYPVKVANGIKGAIMVPERTHYPEDIIEIISPVNIRERLRLEDGSRIKVTVE